MNVGQVLEVHLGWAGKGIGQRIETMLTEQVKVAEIRKFLDELYNKSGGKTEKLDNLSDAEINRDGRNLTKGVPFATPVSTVRPRKRSARCSSSPTRTTSRRPRG